jgi:hypothetical protein
MEVRGEKTIHAFTMAWREGLLEKDRVFSKQDLRLLVEEIHLEQAAGDEGQLYDPDTCGRVGGRTVG